MVIVEKIGVEIRQYCDGLKSVSENTRSVQVILPQILCELAAARIGLLEVKANTT